jgi:hypothetical protein
MIAVHTLRCAERVLWFQGAQREDLLVCRRTENWIRFWPRPGTMLVGKRTGEISADLRPGVMRAALRSAPADPVPEISADRTFGETEVHGNREERLAVVGTALETLARNLPRPPRQLVFRQRFVGRQLRTPERALTSRYREEVISCVLASDHAATVFRHPGELDLDRVREAVIDLSSCSRLRGPIPHLPVLIEDISPLWRYLAPAFASGNFDDTCLSNVDPLAYIVDSPNDSAGVSVTPFDDEGISGASQALKAGTRFRTRASIGGSTGNGFICETGRIVPRARVLAFQAARPFQEKCPQSRCISIQDVSHMTVTSMGKILIKPKLAFLREEGHLTGVWCCDLRLELSLGELLSKRLIWMGAWGGLRNVSSLLVDCRAQQ